jgi:hypothetical protein
VWRKDFLIVNNERIIPMTDTVSSNNTALTPKPRGFQKGNPGRPKGARNKATVMAERLMEKDIKGVINVIVGAALNGDLQACKIIMDKIVPQAKSRRVEFPMPPIESLADVAEAYDGLWKAVSTGRLAIDEAQALGTILDKQAEFMRSRDLERRIERLESDREHRI